MVHQIKRALLLLALVFLSLPAQAQVTQLAQTGMPSPQLTGNGAPSALFTCNASTANLSYLQLDATNGRMWLCDNSTGSLAWEQLFSPIKGVATTGTITGGTTLNLLGGGCLTTATVTMAGAVVGTNSATASPIFATAPTATNIGLLNVTAWVSAANTVSVGACSAGLISTVPNFQAKVLLY